jgi:hypothetical protein
LDGKSMPAEKLVTSLQHLLRQEMPGATRIRRPDRFDRSAAALQRASTVAAKSRLEKTVWIICTLEENSMKQLRNKSFDSARTNPAQLAVSRMVSERGALSNGTSLSDAAPTAGSLAAGNGCISELSSNEIHGYSHDHAVAMKNYATIYERFQAYLEPANILATHDYDLSTRPVEEHEHLGCLDQEFMECATNADSISDEDIEGCGYLGWLRH